MRITLTEADMEAAKDGATGFEKVYSEVQPVISAIAWRLSDAGTSAARALTEELEAEANAFLWDLIITHDWSNPERNVGGYLVRSLETKMMDARRAELNTGVDHETAKRFLHALKSQKANGDLDIAERMCAEGDGVRKMGADYASAARRAWEVTTSMATPVAHGGQRGGAFRGAISHVTLADTLEDKAGYVDAFSPARTRRIQMVIDLLESMSEDQADVLMAVYGKGLESWEVQEIFGLTSKTFTNAKSRGRVNFHSRFDYFAAYGDPIKPPLPVEGRGRKQGGQA